MHTILVIIITYIHSKYFDLNERSLLIWSRIRSFESLLFLYCKNLASLLNHLHIKLLLLAHEHITSTQTYFHQKAKQFSHTVIHKIIIRYSNVRDFCNIIISLRDGSTSQTLDATSSYVISQFSRYVRSILLILLILGRCLKMDRYIKHVWNKVVLINIFLPFSFFLTCVVFDQASK